MALSRFILFRVRRRWQLSERSSTSDKCNRRCPNSTLSLIPSPSRAITAEYSNAKRSPDTAAIIYHSASLGRTFQNILPVYEVISHRIAAARVRARAWGVRPIHRSTVRRDGPDTMARGARGRNVGAIYVGCVCPCVCHARPFRRSRCVWMWVWEVRLSVRCGGGTMRAGLRISV